MTTPANGAEGVTLFDAAQVAVILGKSERFVRDEANARRLPYVRIGRSLRFTERNLLDYIEGSTQAATPRHPLGRVARRRKAS